MAAFVPVLSAFLYGGTLFEPRHAQLLWLGYGDGGRPSSGKI
jgi:hypothetical protein